MPTLHRQSVHHRATVLLQAGITAPDFKHKEVLPRLTGKVLDTIEEWAEEPFFIYFPLPAPHTPILPAEEFIGKSKTNSYGDFVLMCDDVVGKNYIFRGHKADIYEGGHRIPLIVKWPERIKSGRVSNELVCLNDFMATMADILGCEIPDNAAEDSVSNLPIWLGETYAKPLREAIVHHSVDGSFSIRKGKWKLEMCPGSGGWSYPRPGEEPEGAPKIQLYNLEKDISERKNVYDKYPEVLKEMRTLLIKYIMEGHSTPGKFGANTGSDYWEELHWM
jgi:arylsulfatase A